MPPRCDLVNRTRGGFSTTTCMMPLPGRRLVRGNIRDRQDDTMRTRLILSQACAVDSPLAVQRIGRSSSAFNVEIEGAHRNAFCVRCLHIGSRLGQRATMARLCCGAVAPVMLLYSIHWLSLESRTHKEVRFLIAPTYARAACRKHTPTCWLRVPLATRIVRPVGVNVSPDGDSNAFANHGPTARANAKPYVAFQRASFSTSLRLRHVHQRGARPSPACLARSGQL